eukprot:TRINITY_DN65817_c0_g1_i1.p1 TRINITY_DN65817_c0_g1~~TRINITY_DN65817_c0_g1_i1.p1  ORF type:complete len:369 (+),score=32.58 TRINITY_DN65817_c0_g1_i1:259-1365(+)
MPDWTDEDVVNLARRNHEPCLGLVVTALWPMPEEMVKLYDAFAVRLHLAAGKPDSPLKNIYVYPGSSLHCTVATLRAFKEPKVGPPESGGYRAPVFEAAEQAREYVCSRWIPLLDRARQDSRWPNTKFRIRFNEPTFEGSAGIIRYQDIDGGFEAIRACIVDVIHSWSGRVVIGGEDKKLGRAPRFRTADGKPMMQSLQGDDSISERIDNNDPGAQRIDDDSPFVQRIDEPAVQSIDDDGRAIRRIGKQSASAEPGPHVPDIVHSTVFRWIGECTDVEAARQAFNQVVAESMHSEAGECTWSWERNGSASRDIYVNSVSGIFESYPFMHMMQAAEAPIFQNADGSDSTLSDIQTRVVEESTWWRTEFQ